MLVFRITGYIEVSQNYPWSENHFFQIKELIEEKFQVLLSRWAIYINNREMLVIFVVQILDANRQPETSLMEWGT